MDQNALRSSSALSPSTMLDSALRIGLVAVLVYACARIVLPFAFILLWSAILAVMLYPLHLHLAHPAWGPRVGTADWAGRRRDGVGTDGHRGDVARDFTLFADLEPAEPRRECSTAAPVARWYPAGG